MLLKKSLTSALIFLILINPLLTSVSFAMILKPAIDETGGLPGQEIAVSSLDGWLYLWNLDRSPVKNFPKELEGYAISSPSMLNVDGDEQGFNEIAVLSQVNQTYYLNILTNGGNSIAPAFPLPLKFVPSSAPTGYDFDDNGQFELLIGGADGTLYIWDNLNLNQVTAPTATTISDTSITPVIVDVNNDQIPEIVVYDARGVFRTYSLKEDGLVSIASPVTIASSQNIQFRPLISDRSQEVFMLIPTVTTAEDGTTLTSLEKYLWADGWQAINGNWVQLTDEKVIDLVEGDFNSTQGLEIGLITDRNNFYLYTDSGKLVSGFPRQIEKGAYSQGLGVLPATIGHNYEKVLHSFGTDGLAELEVPEVTTGSNWGSKEYHQPKPQIPTIAVAPTPFSPNNDQIQDEAVIKYGVTTRQPIGFNVQVKKGSSLINTLANYKSYLPFGYANLLWSGSNYQSGEYQLVFQLNSKGNPDVAYSKTVFVDTTAPTLSIKNIEQISADGGEITEPSQGLLINSKQGLQLTYQAQDNYTAYPKISMQLIRKSNNEAVDLDVLKVETTDEHTVNWYGEMDTETDQFLSDDAYEFRIYAEDVAGNRSEVISNWEGKSSIIVDRTPPELLPTALPMIVKDQRPVTQLKYELTKERNFPVNVVGYIRSDDRPGAVPVKIFQDQFTEKGIDSYSYDTSNLEDGSYTIEFVVTDAVNNSATISTSIIKNNMRSKITKPDGGTLQKNQTIIKGIAADPNWFNDQPFSNYQIYYHQGNFTPQTRSDGNLALSEWRPIPVPIENQNVKDVNYPDSNRSIKPVTVENTLAYWNFAQMGLSSGEYTILLVAYEEESGDFTYNTQVVQLEIDPTQLSPILNLGLSTSNLTLDVTNEAQELQIDYQVLNKESNLEFNIVAVNEDGRLGNIVWSYHDYSIGVGESKQIQWAGTDLTGGLVNSGNYRLIGTAEGKDGVGVVETSLDFVVTTPLIIYTNEENLSFDPYQGIEDGLAQVLSTNYSLSKKALVNVVILDHNPMTEEAQVIKTVAKEKEQFGNRLYSINWNGTSDLYPDQILPFGEYFLMIEAQAGNESKYQILSVSLDSTNSSERVNATLQVHGVDQDQNGIVETQGSSDFIYQAVGLGTLEYFPPKEYEVTLSATGKQSVKQYIQQYVELGYQKWFERINITAEPTIKWHGNTEDNTESYSFLGEIEVRRNNGEIILLGSKAKPTFEFNSSSYPEGKSIISEDLLHLYTDIQGATVEFAEEYTQGFNDGFIDALEQQEDQQHSTFGTQSSVLSESGDYRLGFDEGYAEGLQKLDEREEQSQQSEATISSQSTDLELPLFSFYTVDLPEWSPSYNAITWSVVEEANEMFKNTWFKNGEFLDNAGELLEEMPIKAANGTRIDPWSPFDISAIITPKDSFWGYEEATATIELIFDFENYGMRDVILSGYVDYYHPLQLEENATHRFNSNIVQAMSEFQVWYAPLSWTAQVPSNQAGAKVYSDSISFDSPIEDATTGDIVFAPIRTTTYIMNEEINWPNPENSVHALPPLLAFVDQDQDGERDQNEKLYADYGVNSQGVAEGISQATLSGQLSYGESVTRPLLKTASALNGLLDLSSQQRVAEETLEYSLDFADQAQVPAFLTSIDYNKKQLTIAYNSNQHETKAWSTQEDPALLAKNEGGLLVGTREIDLSKYNFAQEIFLSDDYPFDRANYDGAPSEYTFLLSEKEGIIPNPYVHLDSWDIDLFYIDGTENTDLIVADQNVNNHSFQVQLKSSIKPKRLIPIMGNITGEFAAYQIFYFKRSEDQDLTWHKVQVPTEYQGTDGNPYVSVVQVNGATDLQDNDQDGFIDEDDERGIIGYIDAANLNGVHTVILQLTDQNGDVKNVRYNLQVGKIVSPNSGTVITSSYNLASLTFTEGSVTTDTLISITPTDLNHVDLQNIGDLHLVGPIINLQPSGLTFSSSVDGIDNDQDGTIDEADEEKRPTLSYRISKEEYQRLIMETNDLNLYYLNSNGNLEALNTAVQIHDGYVEFSALIDHFSEFTLLEGTNTLEQITLIDPQTLTNSESHSIVGKGTSGKTIGLYQTDSDGEFASDQHKDLIQTTLVESQGEFEFTNLKLSEGDNYYYLAYLDEKNTPIEKLHVVLDLTPATLSEVIQTPEPFKSAATEFVVDFTASEAGKLMYTVINELGQIQYQSEYAVVAGANSFTWDGKDPEGELLSDGIYQYHLNLFDQVGNFDADGSSYQGFVTIDNSQPGFDQYQFDYSYFSPNGDGVQDNLCLSFVPLEPVEVRVEVFDPEKNLLALINQSTVVSDQKYQLNWNGRIEDQLLPDGKYDLVVTMSDTAGNDTIIEEAMSIDQENPAISVNVDQMYYDTDVTPKITVTDANLADTTLELNGDEYFNGTTISDEGDYLLVVTALDQAGNEQTQSYQFVLDKTSPVIQVNGVEDQGFYNMNLLLTASIEDMHLDIQEIYLNDQSVDLVKGVTLTEEKEYNLQIIAQDLAGNEKQIDWNFTIDKRPPEIIVEGIEDEQGYNINLTPQVTVNDLNLQGYEILLDGMQYSSGTEIRSNGQHLLQIQANDHAGNQSEMAYQFIIDKVAPFAPRSLTGEPGDAQVRLEWLDCWEKDLKGYNVYRDGVKVNDLLIEESNYLDENLMNGQSYTYYITGVDWLENESNESNTIEGTPGYDVEVTVPNYSPDGPYAGQELTLTSQLANTGYVPFDHLKVHYYDGYVGAELINEEVVSRLELGQSMVNQTIWNTLLGEYGTHEINILADPLDDFAEIDENNNLATIDLTLAEPLKIEREVGVYDPWVLVWGSGLDDATLSYFQLLTVPQTMVVTKEDFERELRSGKYTMVIFPANTRPLNAQLYREIRELVYGGNLGILTINYGKAYHPILKELFGIYYRGQKSVDNLWLAMKENSILTLSDLTLNPGKIHVFGTTHGNALGEVLADLPNGKKSIIQRLQLTTDLILDAQSDYLMKVELYDRFGNLEESEEVVMNQSFLPQENLDNVHTSARLNLVIDHVDDQKVVMGLENITSQAISETYQTVVTLTNLASNYVQSKSVELNFNTELHQDDILGGFIISKVSSDIAFPGIIEASYGHGKGILFNFDILNTDLSDQAKLKVLDESIEYLGQYRYLDGPFVLGDTVSIKESITSLVLPVGLQLLEKLPIGSSSYNYEPGVKQTGQVDWFVNLEAEEIGNVKYHIMLPIVEGEHRLMTEINYNYQGSYLLYKRIPLEIQLTGIDELIMEIEDNLGKCTSAENSIALVEIKGQLELIKSTQADNLLIYDTLVEQVITVIDKWERVQGVDQQVAVDTHQKLIDLMRIYQHLWYHTKLD